MIGRTTDKIQSKATNSSSQVAARNDGRDTLSCGYPVTDFTPHVLQLLELVDLDNECVAAINLTVTTPNSVPHSRVSTEKGQRGRRVVVYHFEKNIHRATSNIAKQCHLVLFKNRQDAQISTLSML